MKKRLSKKGEKVGFAWDVGMLKREREREISEGVRDGLQKKYAATRWLKKRVAQKEVKVDGWLCSGSRFEDNVAVPFNTVKRVAAFANSFAKAGLSSFKEVLR